MAGLGSGGSGGGGAAGIVTVRVNGYDYSSQNGIVTLPDYPSLAGYATESYVTSRGYITGINSSMVTNALGYTPYNSSNPNGYITASAIPTSLPASDVYAWAKKASLAASDVPNLDWSKITSGKPTTLAGYGISDAFFLHTTSNYLGVRFANGEYATGDKYLEWWNSAGWVNHMSAKYIVAGATSSHFLKGDGSLDNTAYLPLSGGTISGALTLQNSIVVSSGADRKLVLNNTDTESKYQFISFMQENLEYGRLGTTGTDDLRWNNNIVLHSGNIGSYNAGSATKLQTARSIWGKNFDGTANISGDLNLGDGVIRTSKSGTDRVFIDFGSAGDPYIGYGTASAGIDTHICGNTIFLQYGMSRTNGLALTKKGHVLIGTTTDNGYKLDVSGTVAFGTSDACDVILRRASGFSYITATSSLMFAVNGNSNAYALGILSDKNAIFYGGVSISNTLDVVSDITTAGALTASQLKGTFAAKDSYNIKAPSSGWYAIAKFNQYTRTYFRCTLVNTGGDYVPNVLHIEGNTSWTYDSCYARVTGGSDYIKGVRFTRNGTDIFLEIYCTSLLSSVMIIPNDNKGLYESNGSITWFNGDLPATTATNVGKSITSAAVNTEMSHRGFSTLGNITTYGNAIIGGNLSAVGGATFGGDVWTEGTMAMAKLASSSDAKLKYNIKWLSADKSMEVVRALRPTEWNWKKDSTHSFGFIAQDVAPIVPEMVSSINDTLGLEYNQLHAFEIGAIQHIDSEVEQLKRDLKTANNKIEVLESQLNEYRRNAQWQ